MDSIQLIIGLVLAAIVALGAYRFQALDQSGAWAAFILGTVVFGFGGIPWALVLLVFFMSSSGLSMVFKRRKVDAAEKFSKGSKRDARQVLANGGLAGAAVIFHVFSPTSVLLWIIFASAFAAANADTWATELGVLNHNPPRLIISGKQVPVGTSGGVSLVGMLAAIGGSLVIALTAWITWTLTGLESTRRLELTGLIFLAGVLGSVVDSFIGATVQGIYWCPVCQKETEKHPYHTCGTITGLIKGKNWISNDWVNLFCTGSAVVFTLLIVLTAAG